MLTRWGKALDSEQVLTDYPRPQMARSGWSCLNGLWEAAFTDTEQPPAAYDLSILVPFSPEAPLSGVGRALRPGEYLWYRRRFSMDNADDVRQNGRLLMHFGAVDRDAAVFLNGVPIGAHSGGYLPFTFDVTDALQAENTLVVRVQDDTDASYHSRGKQKTDRGGIWYTPQSGIWQTVWMERVPKDYIRSLRITPSPNADTVRIRIETSDEIPQSVTIGGLDIPQKELNDLYADIAIQQKDPTYCVKKSQTIQGETSKSAPCADTASHNGTTAAGDDHRTIEWIPCKEYADMRNGINDNKIVVFTITANGEKNTSNGMLKDDKHGKFVIPSDKENISCKEIADCENETENISYKVEHIQKDGVDTCVTMLDVPAGKYHKWEPDDPRLYGIAIETKSDRIVSYFAVRTYGVGKDADGRPCLTLNGRPYYHNGVLDQGYWPDGLYTAPSDGALIYDIALMKAMGFNMLRKHIKVEPLRWYYHCDRLGMLVWQDMVNGGGRYGTVAISAPLMLGNSHDDHDYRYFAREDAAGRAEYRRELTEMIAHLYNCPCVAMWVPFNEGWGQFDAYETAAYVRTLDGTRTVDHASGWHDRGGGDVKSLHVYFRPYRFRKDRLGRPVALTEFGGYGRRVAGHCFSERCFGYKLLHTQAELFAAFTRLYEREILPARAKGLAASVYTQVSDVEEETNGFVTYDREVVKMPVDGVRAISARLTAPSAAGK